MVLIGAFGSLSFVHLASRGWLSQLGGPGKKFANMHEASVGSHGRSICISISDFLLSNFYPIPSLAVWGLGNDQDQSGNIEMRSLTPPVSDLLAFCFLFSLPGEGITNSSISIGDMSSV